MFLTTPQSSHYRPEKFDHLAKTENHFDWELYYRFKEQRERFWFAKLDTEPRFRTLVAEHFNDFQSSMVRTVRYLEGRTNPKVLDVGLSSEQFDKHLIDSLGAEVTVLDVQQEAEIYFDRVFGGAASFVLGDVNSFSRVDENAAQYDLVYSVGLIEHFPDKTDILRSHVRLTRPGGIVLLYAPLDSELNREFTQAVPEWENFGYRELLTEEELAAACEHPELEVLSTAATGLFSILWARRQLGG
jgi:2-polyprenyl-3-methyl-5-hydroxy-6-metoxy-1,4-benzoquinol methylase